MDWIQKNLILRSAANVRTAKKMMKRRFCPYCGCGCTLMEDHSDPKMIRYLPDPDDVVSEGKPCIKGLTVGEVKNTNRLTSPMIRETLQDDFEKCTWERAYDFIAERLKKIELETGGGTNWKGMRDKVYFLGSGEVTNEANFLMSKLARSHFGSNNIDSCARLCHAATAIAFNRMYGIGAIPFYSIEDSEKSDFFLFIGTDPMEDYPVMFNRVLRAQKNGALMATIDVAPNSTTERADASFLVNPGGILPLLSHLIVMLVDGGDISKNTRQIEGFGRFVESARKVAKENPPSTFGFTRSDMENLYDMLNAAKRPTIGFGMGFTQHRNGTQHVYAVAGLSMMLDAVLFPNRGKVNIQGAGDVGCDPDWRPDISHAQSHGWNMGFTSHEGGPVTEKIYGNDVKFVWVMGTNPAQSMPDLSSLEDSLARKFVVYQHHHPGRTMEFAHAVLPTRMINEEYGTVTNGERRVRGIFGEGYEEFNSENSIGEDIKSNAIVFIEFAQRIGAKGFDYKAIKEVSGEKCMLVPDYSEINCEGVTGYQGMFARKEPRFKKFVSFNYERSHFSDSSFPFVFTTARNRFHFCTGVATRCSRTLRDLAGCMCVFINPEDARVLNISDRGNARLVSSVGEITVRVKYSAGVGKRVIVAPFHYDKMLVNRLTPRDLDPESKTPSYKDVGIRVERV